MDDIAVKLRADLSASERAHSQTIGERDAAQEAANELADAIAIFFGGDIGEHSNLNCPWTNALETSTCSSRGARSDTHLAKARSQLCEK